MSTTLGTRTIITFTVDDENLGEVTRTLPAQWVTCQECKGKGHLFTMSGLDRTCEECSGTGEVAEIIREICNPQARMQYDAMNVAVQLEDLLAQGYTVDAREIAADWNIVLPASAYATV